MTNESCLKQGQKIRAIFTPETQSGGAVGHDHVTEICISQCAGPMGWYDVAIIKRHGINRADELVPIHAAEYVRLLPEQN